MCATSPVVVVGGGNSAGQAALFLAESGSPVTLVIRGPDLERAACRATSSIASSRTRSIDVRTNTTVAALDGGDDARAHRRLGPDRQDASSRASGCSRSSAPIPRRNGCRAARRSTSTGSCSPIGRSPTSSSTSDGRRSAADRCPSRRAIPGCSRSATSVPDRPNASPPRSAKARPRSAPCTSTSPSRTDLRREPSRVRRSVPVARARADRAIRPRGTARARRDS